jgi:hypothetical protein
LEEKKKLIKGIIMAEESKEIIQVKTIKQKVLDFLIKEKGFDPSEIEIDPEFRIALSDSEFTTSMDYIINLASVSFLVIKCVSTAIESWERYVISVARVVKDYQIPYAVVTDYDNVRLIDILKGSSINESLGDLFNRREAVEKMKEFKKISCPENRIEKEKRIIYAFEGIKCPTIKDPGDR